MAKSSLGKAVSRVGASGGGRTYRRHRPGGYYTVLGIVVALGLTSVVYSRYELTHPYVANTTFPAKNSEAFFGFAVDGCGQRLPNWIAHVDSGSAFVIGPTNVVEAHPTTDAESGSANMTVQAFVKATPNTAYSASTLRVPITFTAGQMTTIYTAGKTCPSGTPYAGKKAYPVVAYWTTEAQNRPTIVTDADFTITPEMLVTFAFVPKGVDPFQPSGKTYNALLDDESAASTTTTSTAPTSTSSSTTTPTTLPGVPPTLPTTTTTTVAVTTTTKG